MSKKQFKHILFDILKRILDPILFNCYLAFPKPALGHYQGVSLSNPVLITAILTLEVHGNLIARLGRYKLLGDL